MFLYFDLSIYEVQMLNFLLIVAQIILLYILYIHEFLSLIDWFLGP